MVHRLLSTKITDEYAPKPQGSSQQPGLANIPKPETISNWKIEGHRLRGIAFGTLGVLAFPITLPAGLIIGTIVGLVFGIKEGSKNSFIKENAEEKMIDEEAKAEKRGDKEPHKVKAKMAEEFNWKIMGKELLETVEAAVIGLFLLAKMDFEKAKNLRLEKNSTENNPSIYTPPKPNPLLMSPQEYIRQGKIPPAQGTEYNGL